MNQKDITNNKKNLKEEIIDNMQIQVDLADITTNATSPPINPTVTYIHMVVDLVDNFKNEEIGFKMEAKDEQAYLTDKEGWFALTRLLLELEWLNELPVKDLFKKYKVTTYNRPKKE